MQSAAPLQPATQPPATHPSAAPLSLPPIQASNADEFQALEKALFYALREKLLCRCGAQRSCEVAGDRTRTTGVRRLSLRCRRSGCSTGSLRFQAALEELDLDLASQLTDLLATIRPARSGPSLRAQVKAASSNAVKLFPRPIAMPKTRKLIQEETSDCDSDENESSATENPLYLRLRDDLTTKFSAQLEALRKDLATARLSLAPAREDDRLQKLEAALCEANEVIAGLRTEIQELRQGMSASATVSLSNATKPVPPTTAPLPTPIGKDKRRYPLSYAAAAIMAAPPTSSPSAFESGVRILHDKDASAADRLQALRQVPHTLRTDTGASRQPATFTAFGVRPGLSVAARATPLSSLRKLFRLSNFPPVAYAKPIGKFAMLFECWVDDRHVPAFRNACTTNEIFVEEVWEPWTPKESSLGTAADVEIARRQFTSRIAKMISNPIHPVGHALQESMHKFVPSDLRATVETLIRKISRTSISAPTSAPQSAPDNSAPVEAWGDQDMDA
ncbi:hypothetical protein HK405_014674 [Cladochytrium tenue]|nr:hypothetical protein HK405_014674 [Cladochytrium tenue]